MMHVKSARKEKTYFLRGERWPQCVEQKAQRDSSVTELYGHVERWSETPDPFLRPAQDPETTVAPQLKNQRS